MIVELPIAVATAACLLLSVSVPIATVLAPCRRAFYEYKITLGDFITFYSSSHMSCLSLTF